MKPKENNQSSKSPVLGYNDVVTCSSIIIFSFLVSLSFSTRGFVKLFEGKSLQRFDPAKTEWEILHSTSPLQGRHKRWASVISTALPPTPCRSNHLLSSTVCWRKHKLFFYQLGWGTVETSISLDQSSLDRFFPFPPII